MCKKINNRSLDIRTEKARKSDINVKIPLRFGRIFGKIYCDFMFHVDWHHRRDKAYAKTELAEDKAAKTC